jgi:hypothetical protein
MGESLQIIMVFLQVWVVKHNMANYTQPDKDYYTTTYDELVLTCQLFVGALSHLLCNGEGIVIELDTDENKGLFVIERDNGMIRGFSAEDWDFGNETPKDGLKLWNKTMVN